MNTNDFYSALLDANLDFFCGVPDSLLKNFCACLADNVSFTNNIITANEGNALAIAAGHYLATGNPGVVYMQNSGLGNIVNPLLSLTDIDVYNIPALLIIGWRGEPGKPDEPQHITQGRLTLPLLDCLGVKYEILEHCGQIDVARKYMRETKMPFAFIVRKNTFESYNKKDQLSKYQLKREDTIKYLLDKLSENDIVVSTTGMISREIYENRITHEKDFLTVGSMGHASSIAFGVALAKPNRKVVCFDGDGALLMHMGAVPVIASRKPRNFKHILLNNEAHDSVGAQPTIFSSINLTKALPYFGYERSFSVTNFEELDKVWDAFYYYNEIALLEIKVKCGARGNLGRPKEKPYENKIKFMNFIKD